MSLTTAVRSLRRITTKRVPGSTDEDVAVFLGYVHEAAVANMASTSYKDEDAIAAAYEKLTEAANADEQWAVNLRDAVLVSTIKPIVDKATEKGVDPVPALVLQADVTEEQAREYVAVLQSRADVPVTADDSDLDLGDVEDEGEADSEGDADSTPVSYGYGSPVASA